MTPVIKNKVAIQPSDKTHLITKEYRHWWNEYFGKEVFEKGDVGQLLVDSLSEVQKKRLGKKGKVSELGTVGDGLIGIHYNSGPNKGHEKIIDISTGRIKMSAIYKNKKEVSSKLLKTVSVPVERAIAFAKVLFGKGSLPAVLKNHVAKLSPEVMDEAVIFLTPDVGGSKLASETLTKKNKKKSPKISILDENVGKKSPAIPILDESIGKEHPAIQVLGKDS